MSLTKRCDCHSERSEPAPFPRVRSCERVGLGSRGISLFFLLVTYREPTSLASLLPSWPTFRSVLSLVPGPWSLKPKLTSKSRTVELLNSCTLQLLALFNSRTPSLPPHPLSFRSALCQYHLMGNKDRRSREKKKPKKETPKLAPPPRATHQTTTPPVVTRTPEPSQ